MNNSKKNTQKEIFILNRIKNLVHLKSDKQLAKAFDISTTRLSNWKSRGSLDYKVIVKFCEINDLDLNYVFLGKENFSSITDESASVEILASYLIKKLKTSINEEIVHVKAMQSELLETLDNLKVKEELEKSKKKLVKQKNS